MAFAAGTVWEVQSGGDDTNHGGGFDPSNASMATDLTATSATGNSPVVTSASYTFVAGDVGHWLYVKSGTNWTPGWYQIVSVDAGAATLSAAVGAAVGYTCMRPNTTAGCATTASPTGGTWSIDYSQATPRYSFTDLVIDGTTNTIFTSTANPVGKNMVGNVIAITAGTGFTVQRVQILSTSGTQATVDKSLGTLGSTGGTGKMGGPMALPRSVTNSLMVASNRVFIQSGTYLQTAAITPVGGSSGAKSYVIGYQTVRGDLNGSSSFSNHPICRNNNVTTNVFDSIPAYTEVWNIAADGGSGASKAARCFSWGANQTKVVNCQAKNFTQIGFVSLTTQAQIIRCQATSNIAGATGGFNVTNTSLFYCSAVNLSCTGFVINSDSISVIGCVAGNLTGASSDGFQGAAAANGYYIGCSVYSVGRDGIRIASGAGGGGNLVVSNCIFEACAGTAINSSSVTWVEAVAIDYNAFYNNGATHGNVPTGPHDVPLSGSPFTDGANNDYTLNNTVGRGAACRAAGFPGVMSGLTGTGYRDLGAFQHQDAGGSTSYVPVPVRRGSLVMKL